MLTDTGRDVALDATERLNRTVFADPGLAPAELETVIDLLGQLRRGAGDF